jgi:N4-(beta-N-acetylglucosaminyl)-L-asparaginase
VSEKLSRRKFVMGGAAIVAAGQGKALDSVPAAARQEPTRVAVRGTPAGKPVVISAANGNKFKNGGKVTCVEKAFAMITEGADVLDAVIAGVNILELDPEETSVGYGGLPNADGVVQLDA